MPHFRIFANGIIINGSCRGPMPESLTEEYTIRGLRRCWNSNSKVEEMFVIGC